MCAQLFDAMTPFCSFLNSVSARLALFVNTQGRASTPRHPLGTFTPPPRNTHLPPCGRASPEFFLPRDCLGFSFPVRSLFERAQRGHGPQHLSCVPDTDIAPLEPDAQQLSLLPSCPCFGRKRSRVTLPIPLHVQVSCIPLGYLSSSLKKSKIYYLIPLTEAVLCFCSPLSPSSDNTAVSQGLFREDEGGSP